MLSSFYALAVATVPRTWRLYDGWSAAKLVSRRSEESRQILSISGQDIRRIERKKLESAILGESAIRGGTV
jgi:hypothetical protein